MYVFLVLDHKSNKCEHYRTVKLKAVKERHARVVYFFYKEIVRRRETRRCHRVQASLTLFSKQNVEFR